MFDLQKALSGSHLSGGTLHSFDDLRKAMSDIRIGHIAELPPEVGVNELIRIGRRKSLIREDEQGRMFIVIPSPRPNGTPILRTKDSTPSFIDLNGHCTHSNQSTAKGQTGISVRRVPKS
jgi:hypothetical protein